MERHWLGWKARKRGTYSKIGEDHAVVVQTDELGVERVVMLRIESAAEYAERQ
jgi:hypothetical protein